MRRSLLFLVAGILFAALPGAEAKPDFAAEAAKIDAILKADWSKNKLQPNPPASDATFVRRIYLDLIGRIPTTRETSEFLESKAPDKRDRLIDKLLASEGYTQHFFNFWADVLRAQSNGPQAGGITGAAYTQFLKQSLRDNKPYDQLVRDLVTAQGKAWDNGAIGYYMRDRGMPLDNMANTVRIFLGTRIECAQCHNHPFDKWTQMQFFQMAAFTYSQETQDYYGERMTDVRDELRKQESAVRASFKEPQRPRKEPGMSDSEFAKLEKKYQQERDKVRAAYEEARRQLRREQNGYQEAMTDIRNTMRYTSVATRDRRVTLPHDYQYSDAKPRSAVEPAAMMGHEAITRPGETPLEAYARWMTSPENPRFTSVIVNRLWKKAFGLALIEPLDELMDTTVPMIPEMQTHLEKLMVSLNYDMKAFLRIVLTTSAYQSQVTSDEISPGTVYHFTGPVLRRMTAEQMWDSFVTLINPDPDMPNLRLREDQEQRVLQARKISDSVNTLSVEEAYKGIEAAAAIYNKNRERTEAKQKLYLEARTTAKEWADKAELLAGDARKKAEEKAAEYKKKADGYRSDINAIQREGRTTVMNEVLLPGTKKLYEEVTGKPWQGATVAAKSGASSSGGSDSMMNAGDGMMMSTYGVRMERVTIPGYDRKELTPEQKKAAEARQQAALIEEARYFGIDEKNTRDYMRARDTQMRTYIRAAEIDSPAPRGHYLREFGQSDRETIENANYDASVPQALAMMNGQLLPQILSKYSQLMLSINKAPYPDDKIEAAYMAILSRPPTTKEKQTWLAAQDKGLDHMDDLIFALLNTQQFIFIQ